MCYPNTHSLGGARAVLKQRIKRILFCLMLFPIFAGTAAIAQAETKFKNHIDFLQPGTLLLSNVNLKKSNLKSYSLLALGYHFTTVELGRLNTLGFGFGITATKSERHNERGENKRIGDWAVTTSQSIRLSGGNRENAYLNMTYGFNMLERTHGLYIGLSEGW